MDTQPKSRASVNRKQNAALLSELLADCESILRQQARKHAELPEDVDDVLQSAYLLFIERYRGDWEPLAWLQTTVKRECWALYRKASRRRVRSLDAANRSTDSDGPWVEALPSPAPDPEERAERGEDVEEHRRALAELKPAERRALGLLAAGLSYAEICDVTGWSHTKVNRCLAEGRAGLRHRHMKSGA
jgi:RNA polymerase sigma factor (sigma-70 family)